MATITEQDGFLKGGAHSHHVGVGEEDTTQCVTVVEGFAESRLDAQFGVEPGG